VVVATACNTKEKVAFDCTLVITLYVCHIVLLIYPKEAITWFSFIWIKGLSPLTFLTVKPDTRYLPILGAVLIDGMYVLAVVVYVIS
jgi:hypothetical protein